MIPQILGRQKRMLSCPAALKLARPCEVRKPPRSGEFQVLSGLVRLLAFGRAEAERRPVMFAPKPSPREANAETEPARAVQTALLHHPPPRCDVARFGPCPDEDHPGPVGSS